MKSIAFWVQRPGRGGRALDVLVSVSHALPGPLATSGESLPTSKHYNNYTENKCINRTASLVCIHCPQFGLSSVSQLIGFSFRTNQSEPGLVPPIT